MLQGLAPGLSEVSIQMATSRWYIAVDEPVDVHVGFAVARVASLMVVTFTGGIWSEGSNGLPADVPFGATVVPYLGLQQVFFVFFGDPKKEKVFF